MDLQHGSACSADASSTGGSLPLQLTKLICRGLAADHPAARGLWQWGGGDFGGVDICSLLLHVCVPLWLCTRL